MSRIIKVVANTVIIEAKASEASVLAFYFPPPAFLSDTRGKVGAKALITVG